mgnify:CR=1 FL=1
MGDTIETIGASNVDTGQVDTSTQDTGTVTSNAEATTGTGAKDGVYTKEDVSRIIQSRLAEEQRKYSDYDKLRSLAARLEQVTGRTSDDIVQQLDVYNQQLEAQQAGLTPQAHQEINMAKQAAAFA